MLRHHAPPAQSSIIMPWGVLVESSRAALPCRRGHDGASCPGGSSWRAAGQHVRMGGAHLSSSRSICSSTRRMQHAGCGFVISTICSGISSTCPPRPPGPYKNPASSQSAAPAAAPAPTHTVCQRQPAPPRGTRKSMLQARTLPLHTSGCMQSLRGPGRGRTWPSASSSPGSAFMARHTRTCRARTRHAYIRSPMIQIST
jgi:hypothetical protein